MTGRTSARRGRAAIRQAAAHPRGRRARRAKRRAAQTEANEIAVWLAIAEPAFAFWHNEVDDAYNSI